MSFDVVKAAKLLVDGEVARDEATFTDGSAGWWGGIVKSAIDQGGVPVAEAILSALVKEGAE